MTGRRLLLIADTRGPLAQLEGELAALSAWAPQPISVDVIVCGRTASWLPEGVSIANSAVTRAVGTSPSPALGDALRLAAARPPHALAVLLVGEPATPWADALQPMPDFKATVTLGPTPPAAVGQGLLGAPFRAEHLALGLRWLVCELLDRTWWCTCGALRVLGGFRACARCSSTTIPRHVELSGRVLALPAYVFPHHLGRALAFDAPPIVLEATLPDGPLTLEAVTATIRSDAPAQASREIERPLRSEPDRCAGCEGALTPPITYAPPDPRRFCATCTVAPWRCDFCNTPLGLRGGNTWPDGRAACRECWATAVTDVGTLESLARRASAWLTNSMQLDPGPCPVRFEHAASIAAMSGRTFTPGPGHTARAVGFFAGPPVGPLICIEHGTPRSIAYGVLVHELSHAWQWQHWPRPTDRVLIEGHAMWLEYQAQLAEGAIHAARHTELYGDPVYGLGFRLALAVEAREGAEYVKRRLFEVTSWP